MAKPNETNSNSMVMEQAMEIYFKVTINAYLVVVD